ncbi:MAG: hypothetical protein Q7T66_04765 [Herminiimonas sp.]|uniref:hypothetical protein n=1 Tax=Herminiimonas sp. TaxID=1926289 RepID=UPI002716CD41|nr:hypothetical protein [Herminiimonas sp.]MDO9419957.1 hypothetical protein [Herminiimonas sp.]
MRSIYVSYVSSVLIHLISLGASYPAMAEVLNHLSIKHSERPYWRAGEVIAFGIENPLQSSYRLSPIQTQHYATILEKVKKLEVLNG